MESILLMAPQGGEAGGGSMVGTIIMLGSIFLIFYFMIIRPQNKKMKEREKMLNEIQKGDKVITSGGLHGTIANIDEKVYMLDLGGNVKVKIEKSAVTTVVKNN